MLFHFVLLLLLNKFGLTTHLKELMHYARKGKNCFLFVSGNEKKGSKKEQIAHEGSQWPAHYVHVHLVWSRVGCRD